MKKNTKLMLTFLMSASIITITNITSFADTQIIDTNVTTEVSGTKRIISGGSGKSIITDDISNTIKETENNSENSSENTEIHSSEVENTEEEKQNIETPSELAEAVDANTSIRSRVAALAESWVGRGVYRYGGTNPATGVDCSGFARFVLANAAGVHLNRSSGSQAAQGSAVPSIAQARPGDLIFYAKSGRINHVAVYIGNGRVVSASTPSTGIRITAWNYRTPVAIKNVLG